MNPVTGVKEYDPDEFVVAKTKDKKMWPSYVLVAFGAATISAGLVAFNDGFNVNIISPALTAAALGVIIRFVFFRVLKI